jgi:pimeloyl-ACP methyl ester carboxylesterase
MVLLVVSIAACGGVAEDEPTSITASDDGSTTVPSSTTTTSALSPPTTQSDSIAGRLEIGDGRSLFMKCEGTGSPTILLEAGDNSDYRQWDLVRPRLSESTRTFAYDRSGLGQSDPASGCRGLDDLLGDLESLLQTADIEGPYILVGTSGGGFIMAGFGARHPEDIAGLVLVETPMALNADLYPEVIDLIRCDAPENVERRDYLTVEHSVWDNRAEIGDFPMVVITNDWGPDADRDEATNVEDQRGWLVLSPNSRQIVVTSGHHVQENEPDLLVNEILSVLESSR